MRVWLSCTRNDLSFVWNVALVSITSVGWLCLNGLNTLQMEKLKIGHVMLFLSASDRIYELSSLWSLFQSLSECVNILSGFSFVMMFFISFVLALRSCWKCPSRIPRNMTSCPPNSLFALSASAMRFLSVVLFFRCAWPFSACEQMIVTILSPCLA